MHTSRNLPKSGRKPRNGGENSFGLQYPSRVQAKQGIRFPNNKKNKSFDLSVNVFSTAVLIEDTVNSEINIINQTETC